MPGENEALIDARAARVARDLGATGEVGLFLAHRVATLMGRIELTVERDLTMIAANMTAAAASFDADLASDIDEWSEALTGAEPRAAIAALEAWPDGVTRLIRAWSDLLAQLRSPDCVIRAQAEYRVRQWFAQADPSTPMIERVEAEVQRLAALAGTMTEPAAAIARARREVVIRASFDATPEAMHCRRHEIAAERAIDRAIKTIAALNGRTDGPERKVKARVTTAPVAKPEALAVHTTQPQPQPERTDDAPLASFCVGQPPAPPSPPPSCADRQSAPMNREQRRKMQKKIAAASR